MKLLKHLAALTASLALCLGLGGMLLLLRAWLLHGGAWPSTADTGATVTHPH